MKKKCMILAAVLICMGVFIAGCGNKTMLALEMSLDAKTCTVTFDKASGELFATSGSLEVADNEKIVINYTMKGDGTATLKFIKDSGEEVDMESNPQEKVEEMDNADPALEVQITGAGEGTYDIEPGTYSLSVSSEGKLDGKAVITVE